MGFEKVNFEVFKFEKKGASIEGVYDSVEEGGLYGNSIYKLKKEDGSLVLVFSTKVLESLMSAFAIGDKIKIVFTGEKENKKKGQNPVKYFDVYKWE